MESVINEDQYQTLENNKIIGKPKLTNSTISFSGSNNILYCENNVHIMNSSIRFGGDNCLVYLSSSNSVYPLNLQTFHDSLVYIGKNNNMTPTININVQEHQNIIIGDDGIIGSNATIRTSDAHPIYDIESKKRVNHSQSVYIGDHVWIGHLAYITKGSILGSGCILDNNTYVEGNTFLKSNSLYRGNPAKIIRNNVFFTNEYVGEFTSEDTKSIENYVSRTYFYSHNSEESLSPQKIEEILSKFDIEEKKLFIQKLFIQNKKHDRFSI